MKKLPISNLVRVWGIVLSVHIVYSFAQENTKPLTFLDTLNKGREVSVTPADFGITETISPVPIQNQISSESIETVQGNASFLGKMEPKKESGVVTSRFRIQVLASTVQDRVKIEKNNLASKIDFPVSILFEAPYYKLFVGDFALRDEAENHLAQLKNLGYNDAWIVRVAAK